MHKNKILLALTLVLLSYPMSAATDSNAEYLKQCIEKLETSFNQCMRQMQDEQDVEEFKNAFKKKNNSDDSRDKFSMKIKLRKKLAKNWEAKAADTFDQLRSLTSDNFFSNLTKLNEKSDGDHLDIDDSFFPKFLDSLEEKEAPSERKKAKSCCSKKRKKKKKKKIKTSNDIKHDIEYNWDQNPQHDVRNESIEYPDGVENLESLPEIRSVKKLSKRIHPRLKRWVSNFDANRISWFSDSGVYKYLGLDSKDLFEQWTMHQGVHFLTIFQYNFESCFAKKYFIKMMNDSQRISYIAKASLRNFENKSKYQVEDGFLAVGTGDDGKTWIHAKFQTYSPERMSEETLGNYVSGFFGPGNDRLETDMLPDDFVAVGLTWLLHPNGLIELQLKNAILSIAPIETQYP